MRKFACFAFSFAAAALVYFSILPRAAFLWIGGVLIAGAVVCGFCRMRRRLAWILVLSGLAAGFLWSGVYDGAVQKKTADVEALSGGESVCILRDYSEIKDYGMRLDGDILTPEGKRVRAEIYVFTEAPEVFLRFFCLGGPV